MDCDVLIVGSGVGGLTAAIAARSAGLRTVLVERSHRIGSATSLSGGVMWLPNNPLMVRERIHDSRSAALCYLANFGEEGQFTGTPSRVEAFVDGVVPVVALLEANGIPLMRCEGLADSFDRLPGGHVEGRVLEAQVFDANRLGPWRNRLRLDGVGNLARDSEQAILAKGRGSLEAHAKAAQLALRKLTARLTGRALVSAGTALQGQLLRAALELGCTIHTNAGLVELISESGAVRGAVIDFDGWVRRVQALHGVIVAPGDPAPGPAQAPVALSNGFARLSDGADTAAAIAAMLEVGAATTHTGEAWWALGFSSPAPGRHGDPEAMATTPIVRELHKPNIILVDQSGQRFVNEAASMMAVGRAAIERAAKTPSSQAEAPAFAIMDARHRSRYAFGPAAAGRTPRTWLPGGAIHRSETIDGLARACGIDPAGLEATITRWNAMAAAGEDKDFGKGRGASDRYFGDPSHAPNPCLGKILRAPFYAAPLQPVELGSCDGVTTDAHARVTRGDGTPIPGLYATGTSAAPLAGPNYVAPGQPLGTSAVFGMIAVRHMLG